eukprot:TRINITY_DN35648_c0_g1_i1.p1 TRINITY_DN35648_c0_g1~~TRINITY_DN35648_c0_g1_i1.p1  ORF type:complete len:714 (-),score=102.19 TRINITY_DN35648_c0_g1_i1:88-2229(-)
MCMASFSRALISRLLWTVCSLTCFACPASAVDLKMFKVHTEIQARFGTSVIEVRLANSQDCAEPVSFSVQLPKDARVTSLTMNMSNGCDMSSDVQSLQTAKEAFEEAASKGQAAAMLSAWNSSLYDVQAVLPPHGDAVVRIGYDELLRRRRGKIDFMLPLAASMPAEETEVQVFVIDNATGVTDLRLEALPGVSTQTSSHDNGTASAVVRLSAQDGRRLATFGSLTLRGSFDVGPLPEDGLLMSDNQGCIVHLFNPPSLLETGPFRKNIVFVIDVSGSMDGQKLLDTKVAFQSLLDSLVPDDAIAIHTFSTRGTEDRFGPKVATRPNLDDAVAFVQLLTTLGSTNLNEAYLDGLQRVQEMQELRGPGYVPILVVMSDGEASTGVTGRQEIMRNVRVKNEGIKAKIYSLAFGASADLTLLMGIALQNGGVAKPIYEGYGDAAWQMEDMVEAELGSVLLSDVSVRFEGVQVERQTQVQFPVLPGGSELAIRAQLSENGRRLRSNNEITLRAVTNAKAYSNGATIDKSWNAQIDLRGDETPSLPRGSCNRAFAHEKIAQLLELETVASAFGNDLADEADSILAGAGADRRLNSASIQQRAKAEALRLALEADLVWPGLTGMIAVQGNGCSNQTAETCPATTTASSDDTQSDDAAKKSLTVTTTMPRPSGQQAAAGSTGGARADSQVSGATTSSAGTKTSLTFVSIAAVVMLGRAWA